MGFFFKDPPITPELKRLLELHTKMPGKKIGGPCKSTRRRNARSERPDARCPIPPAAPRPTLERVVHPKNKSYCYLTWVNPKPPRRAKAQRE